MAHKCNPCSHCTLCIPHWPLEAVDCVVLSPRLTGMGLWTLGWGRDQGRGRTGPMLCPGLPGPRPHPECPPLPNVTKTKVKEHLCPTPSLLRCPFVVWSCHWCSLEAPGAAKTLFMMTWWLSSSSVASWHTRTSGLGLTIIRHFPQTWELCLAVTLYTDYTGTGL